MIERLHTAWQKHRALVRAWLMLVGVIGVFLLLQPLLLAIGFVRWANESTAQLLALALTLLGNPSTASGTLVRSELFSLEIIFECTAILPIVLFAAAVAATPTAKRAKLWALGWGLPAIVLFNLIRLVSLVYIGRLAPQAFETVHLLIWQPLTILFALALWLLWLERRKTS
uniref:Hypothetical conserved protein n=1 Tax=Acetithermum autotrophicum TaxID=1446466 RepID=H5SQX4_ACEAU|nr:hypothetical conserved protein [Candidatus Acetothermum autotrophicum]